MPASKTPEIFGKQYTFYTHIYSRSLESNANAIIFTTYLNDKHDALCNHNNFIIKKIFSLYFFFFFVVVWIIIVGKRSISVDCRMENNFVNWQKLCDNNSGGCCGTSTICHRESRMWNENIIEPCRWRSMIKIFIFGNDLCATLYYINFTIFNWEYDRTIVDIDLSHNRSPWIMSLNK